MRRKVKVDYFEDWLGKKLKNPGFRRGYRRARVAVFLGYRIYRLRTKLRMTQAELARRMGTKQQAIARLERGDYEGFSLRTLLKISEITRTRLVIDFKQTGS